VLDAICNGRSVPKTKTADLAIGSLLELPRRRPDFAAITADLTAQGKAAAAAAKAAAAAASAATLAATVAASRPRSPPPAVPKSAKASPARMQPLAIESAAVRPAAAGQEAERKQEANKGAMHASFRDLRRALTSGRSFSFMRHDGGASRDSSVSGRCDSLPFVFLATQLCCKLWIGCRSATQLLQRLRRCQETQRGCAVTAHLRPQPWRAVHACGVVPGTANAAMPPCSGLSDNAAAACVQSGQSTFMFLVRGNNGQPSLAGLASLRGRCTVRNEHTQMSSTHPTTRCCPPCSATQHGGQPLLAAMRAGRRRAWHSEN